MTKTNKSKSIFHNVLILGFVSLLTDIGTALVFSFLFRGKRKSLAIAGYGLSTLVKYYLPKRE
ncbi:MAG: hypothetical protein KME09_24280 [Pleurocapsa minor HA4230-MV1]|jgi:uncharacterized membrane protein YbjE (DUF340 family)|nr:hypothetical protein [Pleurocapsa minor HA4230-MV1]